MRLAQALERMEAATKTLVDADDPPRPFHGDGNYALRPRAT